MNWIKKIARPLILIVLPAVIIACSVSYKFNGSSINYDKVKTISIADFPIKSEYVYAPLATKFNEDLKDIFIRQTRLQLLKPNQNADLQIDGEITGYNQYNQAVSADGYSSETKSNHHGQCTLCQQHKSRRRLRTTILSFPYL